MSDVSYALLALKQRNKGGKTDVYQRNYNYIKNLLLRNNRLLFNTNVSHMNIAMFLQYCK